MEDIAVLRLEKPVTDGAVPHPLVLTSDWAGRNYMVHGVPESNPRGDWADGKFKGETLGGCVQIQSADGQDLQIDRGFSGAGVWDEQLRGFVGIMVANKNRGGQLKPVSYMIPATILKRAWSELPVVKEDEYVDGDASRYSISPGERDCARANDLSPMLVERIVRALNRAQDGRMATKESTAAFLDTVASDAQILADLWMELSGLYQQGQSYEVPPDFQNKIQQASFNQLGKFGELYVFYGYVEEILGEENDKKLNASFIISVSDFIGWRGTAREILDAGLSTFLSEELGDSGQFAELAKLKDAVTTMKREAGRLAGLAKVYRATM